MLIAASSFFGHLKIIDSLFSFGLTYDFQICSAYKNAHFYKLPNKVINALCYCKLDFVWGKLRFGSNSVLLPPLYLFIEEDVLC